MKLLQVLFLALMSILICSPAISHLIMGAPATYGQKPYTKYPDGGLLKSVEQRKAFANALAERSPIRKMALSTRNEALFLTNSLNSSRIFSGNDKWLFFKGQFTNYNCQQNKTIDAALEHLDVMSAMAELTGPKVLFSISPNKYSIYPDKAGTLGNKFSECYFDQQVRLESRVELMPQKNVLMHHKALKQARLQGLLAYRPHDTHWTELGGLYAFNDVLKWLGYNGENITRGIEFEQLETVDDSDLGNTMLLLKAGYDDNYVPKKDEIANFIDKNDLFSEDILILHDSFYQKISTHIDAFLPKAQRLHFARDTQKIPEVIQDFDHIILNIVERSFGYHFNAKTLGLDSPLAQEVLRRNMNAAKSCHWDDGSDWLNTKKIHFLNLKMEGSLAKAETTDPIILFDVSELDRQKGICLELKLYTKSNDRFEVFLQNTQLVPSKSEWLRGRSFNKKIDAGATTLQFIIPTDENTKYIRVDPIATKSEFSLNSARLVSYTNTAKDRLDE